LKFEFKFEKVAGKLTTTSTDMEKTQGRVVWCGELLSAACVSLRIENKKKNRLILK